MAPKEIEKNIHDINNLLAIIFSSAELIADDLGSSHASHPDALIVLDTCQRAKTLIESLRKDLLL